MTDRQTYRQRDRQNYDTQDRAVKTDEKSRKQKRKTVAFAEEVRLVSGCRQSLAKEDRAAKPECPLSFH